MIYFFKEIKSITKYTSTIAKNCPESFKQMMWQLSNYVKPVIVAPVTINLCGYYYRNFNCNFYNVEFKYGK